MRRALAVLVLASMPVLQVPIAAAQGLAAVPAAASAAPDTDAARRERTRALEEALNRAHVDNAAAQRQLAELQLRLRQVEAAQRNPPLVYGLATLVVLLLVAIVVLFSRLRAQATAAIMAAVEQHPAVHPLALKESPLDHTWTQMRVLTEQTPPSAPAPLETIRPPIATAPAARPTTPELGVEEVLDLEQQADFLVALGQDETAIDLLMSHLRSSGGASAMPYLKLLDIYRRRADADAHERIRQRFNRRFNAHAPAMAADPAAGRSLAEHSPEVMARLQVAWRSPESAVALLESLMVRSEAGDPGFDLPAFGELRLLHAVARDLRERETGEGGVDLLLPLAEEAARVISAGAAPTPDLRLP